MNVISKALLIILMNVVAWTAQAKSLSQCLESTQGLHRIERDEKTLACFNQYKTVIGSDQCFKQITKLKAAQQSQNLSENLKHICFYEASIFQNLKNCVDRTAEFKNAENHDEAVFQCYRQFQETTSRKDCIATSKKLIYPLKKDYLLQHCYNN